MATYLLTWNPRKWPWPDLQDCISQIERQGYYSDRWGCGVTKKIVAGDRVFLMKVGREPRGLVGSGWATSNVYEAPPWESEHPDRPALIIDVRFDILFNPDEIIFPRAWLQSEAYAGVNWSPQASGMTIPAAVAARLKKDWMKFVRQTR